MQKGIKEILLKGNSEGANELEKQEMFALFHQSGDEYELKGLLLEELQNTEVYETSTSYFKNLFTKLWSKIENKESKPRSKTRTLTILGRIAAAVVIGLFLGLYISTYKTNLNPIYYAAHSPKGSISELILPDSSTIFLNADSKIKYSFDGKKGIREVFLEGEAWFDVHKNKKKPFVVHTRLYDVNVTGTQFNIKAYESENLVTTTLEEGSIIIKPTERCRLAEEIPLVPGEQLILSTVTNQVAIKKVNTERFTSWKENKLIFVNMRLQELIILIERRYGVDIDVKNDAILDLHFDGIIKNESIIEILEIIKKTLPVHYNIVGQKIEITAK